MAKHDTEAEILKMSTADELRFLQLMREEIALLAAAANECLQFLNAVSVQTDDCTTIAQLDQYYLSIGEPLLFYKQRLAQFKVAHSASHHLAELKAIPAVLRACVIVMDNSTAEVENLQRIREARKLEKGDSVEDMVRAIITFLGDQ